MDTNIFRTRRWNSLRYKMKLNFRVQIALTKKLSTIESNEEFYYKKGINATQAAKKICDVYGPNAVSVRVAQIWFKRFQSGNFDIKNARHSGRPVTVKIDAIFEKVKQDRHISSYDVAGELGIDHKTVLAHLKKAGYTKKLDIWVPHELTERNLMNHVLICDSLLRPSDSIIRSAPWYHIIALSRDVHMRSKFQLNRKLGSWSNLTCKIPPELTYIHTYLGTYIAS
ncbi:hypothetical protein K1T71_005650 [Dendrolimus kikuchii]|uniref:Uncharacterized protein n=1 Tax=Dendrolimus kikuchii TaxID=765133 RepID=A0ACC1D4T6_9NEOP|nr:hypothetical protein K1T71_005650 [Dendrolimus kikuchii]